MKSEPTAMASEIAATDLPATAGPVVENDRDQLVGRSEAASLLGASVSTLRRLERTTLPPIVDANGVHFHSVKRVLEYKIQHSKPKAATNEIDGTIAAAAFEQFDTGSGAADIVKQLRITPGLARALHREWADLRGSFVVGGVPAAKLERLAANTDGSEVKSGEDIVRLLGELEDNECAGCNRRIARFCLRCYTARPKTAERVAAAAIAKSEQRQALREQQEVEKHAAERANRQQPSRQRSA
jgi:hypothetical protein